MYHIIDTDIEHGHFYDKWSLLYEQLTTLPLPAVLGQVPQAHAMFTSPDRDLLWPGLEPYLEILYKAVGSPMPVVNVIQTDYFAKRLETTQKQSVLLAFSGGKDSVATALLLKKNYDVTLYHLRGINHGYSHEVDYCRKLALMMELPLVERRVHIKVDKGCPFKENPIKNQLIQAAMLEYGLRNNVRRFAFGSGGGDDITDMSEINPLYCMSDFAGSFAAATEYFYKYVADYSCLHLFHTDTEAYWYIYNARPDMMRECSFSSCIMPVYRKPMLHRANVKLFPALETSRCGTCNKCAYEYIHRVLFGVAEFVDVYFAKCVASIVKHMDTDVKVQGATYTENEALETYIDFELLQEEYTVWADFDPTFDNFTEYVKRHVAAGCPRTWHTHPATV